VAADLALLVGIARCLRLEVGARAEIAAGAGEHRDGSAVVGVERKKRVIQFSRGRAVDGVAAMRAVDRNDGNGTIAFDKHGVGFGHVGRSLFVFPCTCTRHSGAMRSIEPGISRFRVWC